MSSIECAFFGVLGRDAEPKTSKTGKTYLRLNVRTGDGDTALWVNTMVFDPEAIAAADRMLKGAKVYVEGKLSLDEWTAQDGSKRNGLSCMSFHCRLAAIGRNRPKRKSDRQDDTPYVPAGNGPAFDDDIPFAPEVR